jgi:hypothetical protein
MTEEPETTTESPVGPNAGSGKGQGWMAPDFNATPDDFAEYT